MTNFKDLKIESKKNYSNYKYYNSLIAAGSSGLTSGYTGFYFESTKKRLQTNQKIPAISKNNFLFWLKESFRGSGSFALSNIPTCIAQQMTHYFFVEHNLDNTAHGKILEPIFSGAVGGIPSAIMGNLLFEQQIKKINPKQALFNLLAVSNKRVFVGTIPLIGRESIFGFCYLKAMDDAKNYAVTHIGASYIIPAQIVVGIAGSLISHPFDTIASTMQKYNHQTIKDATKYLWNENKVSSFYKGSLARVGLFTTSIITIHKTKELVLNALESESLKM